VITSLRLLCCSLANDYDTQTQRYLRPQPTVNSDAATARVILGGHGAAVPLGSEAGGG